MKNLFVTATDTGVGKTLVSTLLVMGLQERGYNSQHYKPVQSGEIQYQGKTYPPDLFFSWHFLGAGESAQDYCLRRNNYFVKTPVSPDLSAEIDGVMIDQHEIMRTYGDLSKKNHLVVEGAGGVAVPLNDNYMISNLIQDCGAKTIVVTRPSLGTLNHTFLTIAYLKEVGIVPAGIIVSGYTGAGGVGEERNLIMLEKMSTVPILGIVPEITVETEEMPFPEKHMLQQLSETSFKWDLIERIVNEV